MGIVPYTVHWDIPIRLPPQTRPHTAICTTARHSLACGFYNLPIVNPPFEVYNVKWIKMRDMTYRIFATTQNTAYYIYSKVLL